MTHLVEKSPNFTEKRKICITDDHSICLITVMVPPNETETVTRYDGCGADLLINDVTLKSGDISKSRLS